MTTICEGVSREPDVIPTGSEPTVRTSPVCLFVSVIVADSMLSSSTSAIVTSESAMFAGVWSSRYESKNPVPVSVLSLASRSSVGASFEATNATVVVAIALSASPSLTVTSMLRSTVEGSSLLLPNWISCMMVRKSTRSPPPSSPPSPLFVVMSTTIVDALF